jgi:trigger factor
VEVTEDEILEALEDLRRRNAILEPIEGRGAQRGDVLRIDVEGRTDEGQLFMKDEGADVLFDPEDAYPAPGFFAALEGMVPGEERSFRLKMPQGQPSEEAEFRVRLLGLYQQILPDLDDDLARTVGPFHSLVELKEDIRQQLLKMKEDPAKEAYAQDVIETLVGQAEVEYPSFMMEEQLERLTEQVGRRIQENEHMTLEDYLKVTGQTMEDLHERLRPIADKEIRRTLVLQEFARAEGLTVSDEEVEQYIQDITPMRWKMLKSCVNSCTLPNIGRNWSAGFCIRKP